MSVLESCGDRRRCPRRWRAAGKGTGRPSAHWSNATATGWCATWRDSSAIASRGEELAQEAFVRLWLASARYREEGRFEAYLYSIGTRLARSERAPPPGAAPRALLRAASVGSAGSGTRSERNRSRRPRPATACCERRPSRSSREPSRSCRSPFAHRSSSRRSRSVRWTRSRSSSVCARGDGEDPSLPRPRAPACPPAVLLERSPHRELPPQADHRLPDDLAQALRALPQATAGPGFAAAVRTRAASATARRRASSGGGSPSRRRSASSPLGLGSIGARDGPRIAPRAAPPCWKSTGSCSASSTSCAPSPIGGR